MAVALVLLVLLAGAAPVAEETPPPDAAAPVVVPPPLAPPDPGVRVAATRDGYAVTNEDGTWTVRTRCRARGGRVVGPGYVSRLVLPDGRVVVDDFRRRGSLNDPEFGGLGAFGWHHARGRPGRLRFTTENAWELSGRLCARANHRFGVVATRVTQPPEWSARGVELAVAVDFSDMYTFPRPLLRVTYRYRFERSVVKSWIEVAPRCASGRCGRTRLSAFVKEPKLVARANGGGYTRMATFADDGSLVCIYAGGGPARGPILKTGQCAAPARTRLRFDYGSATSGVEGGCGARPCLNVVMRSYDDDTATTGPWHGGGLDAWAVASARRAAAFGRDTASIDRVVWRCHGRSPASPRVRRWETHARRSLAGGLSAVGGLFPAWQGGRGGYDCEPLARAFGPAGERFQVFASYSVGPGWEDLR
ncbi:MAG TPA: hypothetical protein VM290_02085 [Gaiellaceae bacterium]|nr:hypothetical protein [Gaiellaceae bacterium]